MWRVEFGKEGALIGADGKGKAGVQINADDAEALGAAVQMGRGRFSEIRAKARWGGSATAIGLKEV